MLLERDFPNICGSISLDNESLREQFIALVRFSKRNARMHVIYLFRFAVFPTLAAVWTVTLTLRRWCTVHNLPNPSISLETLHLSAAPSTNQWSSKLEKSCVLFPISDIFFIFINYRQTIVDQSQQAHWIFPCFYFFKLSFFSNVNIFIIKWHHHI